MEICLASSDAQIEACYPLMKELRPHLTDTSFLEKVRHQEQSGYRLAFILAAERPVAISGFRLGENLAWGRFLYVEDLATLSTERSRGYGAALLHWLGEFAASEGCRQLHLDSGFHRHAAHRFYEREGLHLTSLHFAKAVSSDAPFLTALGCANEQRGSSDA